MNNNYEKYLQSCHLLTESQFDEILDSLPSIEIDYSNLWWSLYDDIDQVTCDIINEILYTIYMNDNKIPWVTAVDFDNKTFDIYGVGSIEQLEEIKEIFLKWTINNEESLLEELKDCKIENREELLKIIMSYDTRTLKRIVHDY